MFSPRCWTPTNWEMSDIKQFNAGLQEFVVAISHGLQKAFHRWNFCVRLLMVRPFFELLDRKPQLHHKVDPEWHRIARQPGKKRSSNKNSKKKYKWVCALLLIFFTFFKQGFRSIDLRLFKIFFLAMFLQALINLRSWRCMFHICCHGRSFRTSRSASLKQSGSRLSKPLSQDQMLPESCQAFGKWKNGPTDKFGLFRFYWKPAAIFETILFTSNIMQLSEMFLWYKEISSSLLAVDRFWTGAPRLLSCSSNTGESTWTNDAMLCRPLSPARLCQSSVMSEFVWQTLWWHTWNFNEFHVPERIPKRAMDDLMVGWQIEKAFGLWRPDFRHRWADGIDFGPSAAHGTRRSPEASMQKK